MKGIAAAVGTFDGVHLGHRAVLSELTKVSHSAGLLPVAVTFDRHPLSLIAPGRAPKALGSQADKIKLLNDTGADPLVLEFDDTLRSLTAEEWMAKLRDERNLKVLVVGYDNTFGCDGINMSVADYKKLGKKLDIKVIEAPYVPGVSSSAIRKAVAEGNIEEASKMLGRDFSMKGLVEEGNHIGRTIGFPTANLSVEDGILIPGKGVYAAYAMMPDGLRYPAMVNIGVRPTIKNSGRQTIEANIIGWNEDLYQKEITLIFKHKIRNEKDFGSIRELKKQLDADKVEILRKLTSEY